MESHVLAGYVVAAPATGAEWMHHSLHGRSIASMSVCVVDVRELQDWHTAPVGEEAAGELVRAHPGERVVAVGFAESDVDRLLADLDDGSFDPGLRARIRARIPLPAGEPLGFEPVGPSTGSFHTWLCLGGFVDSAHRAVGALPGRAGLIEDERVARAAAAHLTEAFPGEHEVGLWVAALLVEVDPTRSGWRGPIPGARDVGARCQDVPLVHRSTPEVLP